MGGRAVIAAEVEEIVDPSLSAFVATGARSMFMITEPRTSESRGECPVAAALFGSDPQMGDQPHMSAEGGPAVGPR